MGLYVGNELLEDTSIPLAMVKVADALRKEFPQTLVLVVSPLSFRTVSEHQLTSIRNSWTTRSLLHQNSPFL